MAANTTELEKRLWEAADQLRANSDLKSHEYSVPVLGLIFLRYADHKFAQAKAKFTRQDSGRRTLPASLTAVVTALTEIDRTRFQSRHRVAASLTSVFR